MSDMANKLSPAQLAALKALDRRGYICWSLPRTLTAAGRAALAAAGV